MDGILLVDKPSGISSFGVVARVRRAITEQTGVRVKVGHTGTLDPMATGLLILAIGKYTKRAAEFSRLDKVYEAKVTLGAVSTTADREGEITKKGVRRPSEAEINNVLSNFIGRQEQTPPAFSAVKVNGHRAYKLARAGKPVTIQPRVIRIYSIKDVSYEYPELRFTVEVSSGTYIRALAEDIGKSLGVGAYLSDLRRTKIGSYSVAAAKSPDAIGCDDVLTTPDI